MSIPGPGRASGSASPPPPPRASWPASPSGHGPAAVREALAALVRLARRR